MSLNTVSKSLFRWQLKNGSSVYTEEEALDVLMEEGEEITGGRDMEQEKIEQDSFVSCFFCGRQFRSKQGCDVHMRNCDEKH